MDDARLQAIKARVDAVPWNTGIGCSLDGIKYYAHGRSDDEDRALIVTLENIKTDVPDLIAALEASRAECARLRVAIGVAATQLDNLDQWHVVSHIRDDLRAALNGAADATVGSEP